jgi:undecaprenyl-diphosphatase
VVSLPVGLGIVLALDRFLDGTPGERPGVVVTLLVGALLVVTGLVLRAAAGRAGGRRVADTGPSEWALLGLLQGLAALPGVSRSGMTVSALLMRRVEGGEAIRLSFVMSVPVVAAAAAYEAVWGDVGGLGWEVLAAGVLSSFVFGYLTLEALLRLSRSMRWDWFCMAFGLLAVAAGAVLLLP